MTQDGKPVTLARIFRFWTPMAGTWLMMSLEGPFLAAIIARLDDPKQNLAAFGVAFSVAILIEAPVIMMLSASTALVDGPASFRLLRRFTCLINGALTVIMLAMLLTPLWRIVAASGIGLPPRVVELTQIALLVLLPWPAAIGYWRFYQGLLIRHGLTRLVAYGTVTRLLTMAITGLILFATTRLPGALIGATALSAGVCVEAVVNRMMVQGLVRAVIGNTDESASARALTYRRITAFYTPLALTSLLGLGVHPAVAFFMGHASFALESLAVLPVVNSLSFLFRSLGLSYQEVAIALIAEDDRNVVPVGRFAALLAVGSSAAMALIAFTPLAWIWFRDVSGLSTELTVFALLPTQIVTVLPALSVLLSVQRAILVDNRVTAPITWSTVVEVGSIVGALVLFIAGMDLVGVTAAAIAFVVGRLGGNLYLVPPCARALRR
jgi:hypothetical protein